MADQELERRFKQCWNYRHAASWAKPMVNPARFLRNQLRHRFRPPQRGTLQRADAFHLDSFLLVAGECVSEEVASYGIYEPELTAAFLQLVRPGHVMVDIGMHLGYFSTLFASLTGQTGEVHSFEPTPSTREIARENVARFPTIRVYPFALWSSAQSMVFQDFGAQWMAFNSLSRARLPRRFLRQPNMKSKPRLWISSGRTSANQLPASRSMPSRRKWRFCAEPKNCWLRTGPYSASKSVTPARLTRPAAI